MNASSTNPVFQLRFVLLYPFDTRGNEPRQFRGGECVEIQSRINNQYVSRFYTPVSGSPVAFEVLIKSYSEGTMSQLLCKQTPGNVQFKIRGPFGTQLFNPSKPLPTQSYEWTPDRLVYIVGGSGITPFLQALQTLFFPPMEPLMVIHDYQPNASDELELRRGEFVFIKLNFYDGWAIGLTPDGREGVIPLGVTSPYCGLKTKITLINQIQTIDDIIGNTILEGAALSYGRQIEMHHIVTHGGIPNQLLSPSGNSAPAMGSNGSTTPGQLYEGRLNDKMLEKLVGKVWDLDGNVTQKVVVIGPRGFDSMVVDVLTDDLGIDVGDIKIMPSDKYT